MREYSSGPETHGVMHEAIMEMSDMAISRGGKKIVAVK